MTYSSLVDGICLTNNCNSPRNHAIDRITPHYMDWYTDGETCCESFVDPERQASANYCIGKDGDIWLNVAEENRAWTSGSRYNDNRAITIECANYSDSVPHGRLPDATWNSLVRLCVDICQRYNFRLNYTGDDSGNLTKHKWYDNTDCPGDWFDGQFERLANEVNSILDGVEPTPEPPSPPQVMAGIYQCMVNGLRVRTEPNLSGQIVAHYNYGQFVKLDEWSHSEDGYSWGRYVGASSGCYRYVALGRDTGKVEDDDFLIKIS